MGLIGPSSMEPNSAHHGAISQNTWNSNGISLNSATLRVPLAFSINSWEFTGNLKIFQRRRALDTSTRSALRSGTGVQPRGWTPVPDLRADLVLVSNALRRWNIFKFPVNSQELIENAKGTLRVAEFNEMPLEFQVFWEIAPWWAELGSMELGPINPMYQLTPCTN